MIIDASEGPETKGRKHTGTNKIPTLILIGNMIIFLAVGRCERGTSEFAGVQ